MFKKRVIWCTETPPFCHFVYCTQLLYPVYTQEAFPRLEPVTLRSHDNNFTGCVKVTPH